MIFEHIPDPPAEEESPRIVLCEACGSEGRIYVRDWVYEHGCGHGHWGERDDGECPWCEGTGGELIATQPIDEEDLEAYAPPAGENGYGNG